MGTPVTNRPTTLPSAAPAVAKAQVWDQYVQVLPSEVQPYWYVALALILILLLCFARTLYLVFCRKEAKELTTDGELEDLESDLEQQDYVISVPTKRHTAKRPQANSDSKRNPHTTTPSQAEDDDLEEAYNDLRE